MWDRVRNYGLIALVLVLGSTSLIAQEVTFEAYIQHYASALSKSRSDAARHTERSSWFKAGRLTEQRTSVLEKDAFGSSRYREEKRTGARIRIEESVEVDGVSYCRIGRGAWSEGKCEGERYTLATSEGETVAVYTVEESASGEKLLKAVVTTTHPRAGGKSTVSFTENVVKINSEGYIVSRDYTSGTMPRRIDHSISETYEYDLSIARIVAPKH